MVPDSCGGQEGGAELHALRAEAEGGGDASAVGKAAGRDDRGTDFGGDDGHERQRPDERVLGGAQERSAVPAGLGARGDDDVDAGLIEGDGLVGRRRGPERHDAVLAGLLEQAGVRHAEDEAERGRGCAKHRLGLLDEARREAVGKGRRLDPELVVERLQPADRGGEALGRHLRLRQIMVRDPQVQRERARRRGAHLLGDRRDRGRFEMVDPEGPEAAGV